MPSLSNRDLNNNADKTSSKVQKKSPSPASSVEVISKPRLHEYLLYFLPSIYMAFLIGYVLNKDYNEHNPSVQSHIQRYYGQLPQMVIYNEFYPKQCSNTYKYCALPKQCGRYASDFLVEPAEYTQLLRIARTRLLSANRVDVTASGLLDDSNFMKTFRSIETRLKDTIKSQFGYTSNTDEQLHSLTSKSYFSKILQSQPTHSDNSEYLFTAHLYLSDCHVDLIGGSFVFNDSNTLTVFEPKQGRTLLYTSGNENAYYVDKVQKGAGYTLTIPFSCKDL